MTTLLEHLRALARETESGAQNAADTFRLVTMKRSVSRPSMMLFEPGDYGLVDGKVIDGVVPAFSFRKSAMTFISVDSFEILPDDTPMPSDEYQVLLAVRAPPVTDTSPRATLGHMPADEWLGAFDLEDASLKCLDFLETHLVTEDIWWGGAVRRSATCVPFATVRFDGSVWPVSDNLEMAEALFTPPSVRSHSI